MESLQEHYEKLSTEQLRIKRHKIQNRIEVNDGRLTAHSSADLDNDLDDRDTIDQVLAKRYSDVLTP
jgi:hypothetical protein